MIERFFPEPGESDSIGRRDREREREKERKGESGREGGEHQRWSRMCEERGERGPGRKQGSPLGWMGG